MLRIENLCRQFGDFTALDHLNMQVDKGELFGFVGPNGAGKTTTIRIISGLLRATSGEVWVNGMRTSSNTKKLKESIGYVPDSFGVYDNLKVSEYLEFFAAAYGIYGKQASCRRDEVLEKVGLLPQREMMVDTLSRGMQQRLCLARALIHHPDFLVLDEPGTGLDPRTRRAFRQTLKDLCEEGYTILISSHILTELSDICTNIGIIDMGKMVLQGQIDEIMLSIEAANPLLITVFKDVDRAAELLRRNPLVTSISIDKNKIAVHFTGSREEEAMLLRQLVEEQIPVVSFMREQTSLETLFFHLTEHEEEVSVYEFESGI